MTRLWKRLDQKFSLEKEYISKPSVLQNRGFFYINMIRTLVILLFLSPVLSAKPYFDFNSNLRSAYDDALSLRLDMARKKIGQFKVTDPNNVLAYHIENYIDFFHVFISEDPKVFDRLKRNKKSRIDLIKKGDVDSPYYLYSQAEIHLQWALARLKFREYLTAFGEISKAFQLLEYNQKRFPDFVANKKSLGVLHALIGTIPDQYKWGAKLMGMEGTIDQGRKEIEEVLAYSEDNDFYYRDETIAMYAFVLFHLSKEQDKALAILRDNGLDHRSNPLACFVKANLALRSGQNELAIKMLSEKPDSEEFLPFPYLDYMLGQAKLQSLDPMANIHFETFLDQYKGQNYIKNAYLKLAWHDLIFNNGNRYDHLLTQCLTKGTDHVDEDKSAQRTAHSGKAPNTELLKARLLYDGGFYEDAMIVMTEKNDQSLRGHDLLEMNYRLARIYQALDQLDESQVYFDRVLSTEDFQTSYLKANSALQMGLSYEKQANVNQAEYYFNLCLEMRCDEYQRGIHQKAKAGLQRLR